MQRIIQINIAGRLIPIEDDAYQILKDYLTALERSFVGEEGREEIIQDIENRIAELFLARLQAGAPAIDRTDAQKVMDTLGSASELGNGANTDSKQEQPGSSGSQWQKYGQYQPKHTRLLRNPYDRMIGGVCSGIANYFDIDPTIVRLIGLITFLTAGIGGVTYIIAWIVIPAAKSPAELDYMTAGDPITFHDITNNMHDELQELKRRGEQMSRELKDFFSKKK